MWNLLKSHPFVLSFCSIVFVFSCLGQTFLISWFNPHIIKEYGLSRTDLSLIYSAATFLSSFFLPYLGRLLDGTQVLYFTVATTVMISIGFTTLALTPHWVGIFLGYLIIRSFGQMTLSLIASTTLSKKFGKHRGKASSLSQLGRTLGEATFPLLLVSLIQGVGWSQASLILAWGFALIFIPLCFFYLRNFNLDPLYEENEKINKNTSKASAFSKKQFYAEWPIIFILLGNSLMPFVLTGLFFQQTSIAEMKGWSQVSMSGAFSTYAIVQIAFLIVSGWLVDKFTATRILPIGVIPLVLGLGVLKFASFEWAPYVYMGLLGIGTGLNSTVRNSFYAENFSLSHLGEVKSIDSSYLVKATAFAPIIFAYVLDRGFSIDDLVLSLWIVSFAGLFMYGYASLYYSHQHKGQ